MWVVRLDYCLVVGACRFVFLFRFDGVCTCCFFFFEHARPPSANLLSAPRPSPFFYGTKPVPLCFSVCPFFFCPPPGGGPNKKRDPGKPFWSFSPGGKMGRGGGGERGEDRGGAVQLKKKKKKTKNVDNVNRKSQDTRQESSKKQTKHTQIPRNDYTHRIQDS